jgi:hypothetical protein
MHFHSTMQCRNISKTTSRCHCQCTALLLDYNTTTAWRFTQTNIKHHLFQISVNQQTTLRSTYCKIKKSPTVNKPAKCRSNNSTICGSRGHLQLLSIWRDYKKVCPNQTDLSVRVTCICVLFQAKDLEIDLKGNIFLNGSPHSLTKQS